MNALQLYVRTTSNDGKHQYDPVAGLQRPTWQPKPTGAVMWLTEDGNCVEIEDDDGCLWFADPFGRCCLVSNYKWKWFGPIPKPR